jgi:hypothetical protein
MTVVVKPSGGVMSVKRVQADLIAFSTVAVETTKRFAQWSGHHIRVGFHDYVIPMVVALWAKAVPLFVNAKRVFLASQYQSLLLPIVLFVVGITAFRIADRKAYEEHPYTHKFCNAVGTLSFIAMTGLASCRMGNRII